MVARSVAIRLKPKMVAEFTRIVEKEVLPMLRKQKGFRDEITLVLPEGLQIVAISFWENEEDANAYSRVTYAQVLQVLNRVLGGAPEIHVFDVANSTVHQIAARGEVSNGERVFAGGIA